MNVLLCFGIDNLCFLSSCLLTFIGMRTTIEVLYVDNSIVISSPNTQKFNHVPNYNNNKCLDIYEV